MTAFIIGGERALVDFDLDCSGGTGAAGAAANTTPVTPGSDCESRLELLYRGHIASLKRSLTRIGAGFGCILLHLQTNREVLVDGKRQLLFLGIGTHVASAHDERDNRKAHRHSELQHDHRRPHSAEVRATPAGSRALEAIAKVARDPESRKDSGDRRGQQREQRGVHEGQRRELCRLPRTESCRCRR